MKRLVSLFVLLTALTFESLACTSAIVAPQRSSEGVPLLWKHRDNARYTNTRIEYISDGRYAYTAVVPNSEKYDKGVYAGINEKGLGVISTATKNLPEATPEEYKACTLSRMSGGVMWNALRKCATIDELEMEQLDPRTPSSPAFGVRKYLNYWDRNARQYCDITSANMLFKPRTC